MPRRPASVRFPDGELHRVRVDHRPASADFAQPAGQIDVVLVRVALRVAVVARRPDHGVRHQRALVDLEVPRRRGRSWKRHHREQRPRRQRRRRFRSFFGRYLLVPAGARLPRDVDGRGTRVRPRDDQFNRVRVYDRSGRASFSEATRQVNLVLQLGHFRVAVIARRPDRGSVLDGALLDLEIPQRLRRRAWKKALLQFNTRAGPFYSVQQCYDAFLLLLLLILLPRHVDGGAACVHLRNLQLNCVRVDFGPSVAHVLQPALQVDHVAVPPNLHVAIIARRPNHPSLPDGARLDLEVPQRLQPWKEALLPFKINRGPFYSVTQVLLRCSLLLGLVLLPSHIYRGAAGVRPRHPHLDSVRVDSGPSRTLFLQPAL